MTRPAVEPVTRQSLSDRLAQRIQEMIRGGSYRPGDRLPAIMELARSFGVGHPTIREALKKLETVGMVEMRHGSGVYVTRSDDILVLTAPDYAGTVTKKRLLDLVRTRMPLEIQSVTDAVRNVTAEQIGEMRRLLEQAADHATDGDVVRESNLKFHQQIALASGNLVLAQILSVLRDLFGAEQQIILGVYGLRERERHEPAGILDAIVAGDAALAATRMRQHLEGVESALEQWDPERHPVAELRGR
ncbi:MAG TPA: FadR/GntR family transcriptional regulator [Gemmatimonadaceae bacterium]|nr:FadR/GntR family transcriptional regulator [Gemmatimonadaceae bacterium]